MSAKVDSDDGIDSFVSYVDETESEQQQSSSQRGFQLKATARVVFVTVWTLTCDVQVECRGVVTERVLCKRRDTEYSGRLVDVLDPFLGPAQIGV